MKIIISSLTLTKQLIVIKDFYNTRIFKFNNIIITHIKVERYDVARNKWEFVAPMLERRYRPAAAAIGLSIDNRWKK